jgi:hypothetical protein
MPDFPGYHLPDRRVVWAFTPLIPTVGRRMRVVVVALP